MVQCFEMWRLVLCMRSDLIGSVYRSELEGPLSSFPNTKTVEHQHHRKQSEPPSAICRSTRNSIMADEWFLLLASSYQLMPCCCIVLAAFQSRKPNATVALRMIARMEVMAWRRKDSGQMDGSTRRLRLRA